MTREQPRQPNGSYEPNGRAQGYDEHDSGEVQRAIEQTRRRIDTTVDEIERNFSPGELIDHALNYMRSGPGEFGKNLGRTIRDNPVPVVLTGIGLAWLASSQARDEDEIAARRAKRKARKDQAREAAGDAKHRLEEMGDRASRAAQKAKQGLHSGTSRMRGYAAGYDDEDEGYDVRERARSGARRARRRAQTMGQGAYQQLADNPVILGALGVVVGALIGGAAPRSRTENRLMGAKGDELRQRGKRLARRAGRVAQETARDVETKAKGAAQDIGTSARETAKQAGQREKDREFGSSNQRTGSSASTSPSPSTPASSSSSAATSYDPSKGSSLGVSSYDPNKNNSSSGSGSLT